MSTRGLIAIEDADRKCRSIFVHFDMYIDGAGETLIKYYKTIKRSDFNHFPESYIQIGEHRNRAS